MSSAQKLLDAWYGKGVGTFRVKSVAVPKFSREMGEAILAHLLINGYLQEDFHFTPYTTISYLKRGRNTDIACLYVSLSVLEMPEVDTYVGMYSILQIFFFIMFLRVHIMVLWFMTLCSGHETYFAMFLSYTTLTLCNLHCTH